MSHCTLKYGDKGSKCFILEGQCLPPDDGTISSILSTSIKQTLNDFVHIQYAANPN